MGSGSAVITFYFEVVTDLQEAGNKDARRGCVWFSQPPQELTSYMPHTVCKKETDIGRVQNAFRFPTVSALTCVYV